MTNQEGAGAAYGAARAHPAWAYLGPVLFILLIAFSINHATSLLQRAITLRLIDQSGWTQQDIAVFLGIFTLAVGSAIIVIQIVTAYLLFRKAMAWFEFLMSPSGRASRADYWLRYWLRFFAITIGLLTPICVISWVYTASVGASGVWQTAVLAAAQSYVALIWIEALLFWPAFCVLAKRCHDRGKSAWWLLLLLVPVVGFIWWLIDLAILPGQPGENQYGPDPHARAG